MANNCPKCGKPITDNITRICSNCGTHLPGNTPAEPSHPDPTPQNQKTQRGSKTTNGEWVVIICCGGIILLVLLSAIINTVMTPHSSGNANTLNQYSTPATSNLQSASSTYQNTNGKKYSTVMWDGYIDLDDSRTVSMQIMKGDSVKVQLESETPMNIYLRDFKTVVDDKYDWMLDTSGPSSPEKVNKKSPPLYSETNVDSTVFRYTFKKNLLLQISIDSIKNGASAPYVKIARESDSDNKAHNTLAQQNGYAARISAAQFSRAMDIAIAREDARRASYAKSFEYF